MTQTGITNMLSAIYSNDSSIEDFVMVLTPGVYASLFSLDDFVRFDGVGNSFGSEVPLVSGFVGKLGGVEVIVSNNFVHYGAASTSLAASATPVGNFSANSVDDEHENLLGFLIHKDAMHIAYSRGMKARVQSDYHLSTLSTNPLRKGLFKFFKEEDVEAAKANGWVEADKPKAVKKSKPKKEDKGDK